MNKFRAKPCVIDGISFASKAEGARYATLKLEERAGLISGLECHPRFALTVNGEPFGHYTADFRYVRDGLTIVEDVKSPATASRTDYRMRKRLMKICHGIDIREVGK